MAVNSTRIHGKFLSMFSKIVMGLPPYEPKEDASGYVEDQDY
jgi:hypothetical protein